MVEPYHRYYQLYRKRESSSTDLHLAIDLFSVSEWRDLQVWSNLVWIDPSFRREPAIQGLYSKGRDFTEEDKDVLLNFEMDILGRIIPAYQKLYQEKKIDVSFTPYYHPILPLLVDSDSAREALPNIALPEHRFQNPEDALWHIRESINKFSGLFGEMPRGMWPSEGSLSSDILKMLADAGIIWTATDEEVLRYSVFRKDAEGARYSPHRPYSFVGSPGLKIFFRDRGLSDKIGFVYSGWETEKAIDDFIQNLKKLKEFLKGSLDKTIVPIILDGENAWEYYKNDGIDFLTKLYQTLSEDNELEVITLSEASSGMEATDLPSFTAGSWINHNFRVWIGHREDNAAWDILYEARKAVSEHDQNNSGTEADRLAQAWRQIHIAEGSDWCWWYGDEHQSDYSEQFDTLFRLHIKAAYDILGITPPKILSKPIHRSGAEAVISGPEALLTPILDGLLTHYYEWSGAGYYDCAKAGGAMHRTDRIMDGIHFAYDRNNFYIRLDFANGPVSIDSGKYRIIIDFQDVCQKEIVPVKGVLNDHGDYRYIYRNILESEFSRGGLLPAGSGKLKLYVMVLQGEMVVEKWPLDDPIVVEIPEKEREIFWQV